MILALALLASVAHAADFSAPAIEALPQAPLSAAAITATPLAAIQAPALFSTPALSPTPTAAPLPSAQAPWQARSVAIRRQMLKEIRPWAPMRYEDEPDGEDGEPGLGFNRGPVTQSVDDSLDALKMQLMHPVNRLYPAVLHPDQPSAEELSWEINDILAEQKERIPQRDLVPQRLRDRTMAFIDAVGLTIGVQTDEETLESYQKRLLADLERASTAIRDAATEAELDIALYGTPTHSPFTATANPADRRAQIALLACAGAGTALTLIGAHFGHAALGFLAGMGAVVLLARLIRRV